MALVNYQQVLLAASAAGSGAGQAFGVPSASGNGIIVLIEFGDITSTLNGVSDSSNGAYTFVQGPNRLSASTTYAYYLPFNGAAQYLDITLAFSNPVPDLLLGIIEYIAPQAAALFTQAQGNVVTNLTALQAQVRAATLTARGA